MTVAVAIKKARLDSSACATRFSSQLIYSLLEKTSSVSGWSRKPLSYNPLAFVLDENRGPVVAQPPPAAGRCLAHVVIDQIAIDLRWKLLSGRFELNCRRSNMA